MGKKATVIGQVSMKGDVYVTGSQVIIGDTTYP
jgi:carbonic anhydrase/acetyltransferase-like protein (isoleucine patch superfamily)